MLDYHPNIAGVVFQEQSWEYVVVAQKPHGIQVVSCGRIEPDSAGPEAFAPLIGCKCVYGINRSQYHRKRLHLADDLAASDPDQFLWELSRCSVDKIENYYYSLLKLHPSDQGLHIECLSINKKAFEEIGQAFDQHQLTLDKLIFEPEAMRQSAKALISDERALLLHVERDNVHLQMFRRGHLVAMEILRGNLLETSAAQVNLAEEIGTLLMSTFGGRIIRTRVALYTSGTEYRVALALNLKNTLPYDFTLFDYPFDRLHIATDGMNNQLLHQYYFPLTLCYAYNKSLKCASSPEKNAVSF